MAKRSLEEELVGVTREQAAQALATLRDLAEPEDDGPAATLRRTVGAVAAMCVRVAEVERERDEKLEKAASRLAKAQRGRYEARARAERLADVLRDGLGILRGHESSCDQYSEVDMWMREAAALADAPEPAPCPECERLETRCVQYRSERDHSRVAADTLRIRADAAEDECERLCERLREQRDELLSRAASWAKMADENQQDALHHEAECERLRGVLRGGVEALAPHYMRLPYRPGDDRSDEYDGIVAWVERARVLLTPDLPTEPVRHPGWFDSGDPHDPQSDDRPAEEETDG